MVTLGTWPFLAGEATLSLSLPGGVLGASGPWRRLRTGRAAANVVAGSAWSPAVGGEESLAPSL